MPQNIYDDATFFAGYTQFRRSRQGLDGAPEWPALQAMLPTMAGSRVLDLGCGFGWFARWARAAGAQSVLGLDLSENMLARARSMTQDPAITYRVANIEELDLPDSSFDLVYSSLALHYIEDFAAVCAVIRKLLRSGGRLVFSVEHPIYTAPSQPGWQSAANGDKVWPVNNYLREGQRTTEWITPGVVKYHRTVATYVNSLLAQGFSLDHVDEWGPSQEQIAERPELTEELDRPAFLLIAARL